MAINQIGRSQRTKDSKYHRFVSERDRASARKFGTARRKGGSLGTNPAPELAMLLSNTRETELMRIDAAETAEFLPKDPLFANQWHLRNTGQGGNTSGVDINVTGVWPEFTGIGVAVGVYDTGLEYIHHDLDGNYNASRHIIIDGVVHDPFPTNRADYHATAVAGLIAAENNGVGTVGVAFHAQLTGVNIVGRPLPVTTFIQALFQQDNFDVVNHSWGFTAPFAINPFNPLFAPLFAGIADAADHGRGGLGTIMMKAAGNDRTAFGNSGVARDANDESFTNSRYMNAVAAVSWDGQVSSYSTPGAAVLVSAPSNTLLGLTRVAGIWTTDRLGPSGSTSLPYQVSPDDDYTGVFGGTSAATPIASGVVALMLEANPGLGWRDVAQILATSARHIGSPVGTGPVGNEHYAWSFNGASNWNGGGLHFSNDYGFGLIDALGAVRLAESWQLRSTSANEASAASRLVLVSKVVPDNDPAGITFTLEVAKDISIEKVALQLNWAVPHPFAADLRITLTAPDGTVSTLQNRTGRASDVGDWIFTSNAFRGELSAGTWTVNVADLRAFDVGTVSIAQLTAYGSSNTKDDLYVYTNEYSKYAGLFGHPTTLSDSDGGTDTINAAAVTLPSLINLSAGFTSMIDGTPLTIASGTAIEDAFGGDGDDTMIGSSGDNTLAGNRGDDNVQGGNGDDQIFGGGGKDRLVGGEGNDLLSGDADNDSARGGDGGDRLEGGDGDDLLLGEAGNDRIEGENGSDRLNGGDGDDRLEGGDGEDLMIGASGDDRLQGENGRDRLRGGAGGDVLDGGDGDDLLFGEAGNDRISGSKGNDRIVGGAGNDRLEGGDGIDLFVFDLLFGNDLIRDLRSNDRIDLSAFGFGSLADLAVKASGGGTLIDLGANGRITLDNVSPALIEASIFIL